MTIHHIDDVALIFEGGGMRAVHSAPVVTSLIEEGISFPHVSGISAGSTHTANYLSRDAWRAKAAFVDIAEDPRCGGWQYFLTGKGMFNTEYLYERLPQPDGDLPFDLDSFKQTTAQMQIGTFNATRGEMRWWGREDIATIDDISLAVRTSSTLPILMPPAVIGGEVYYDGALGPNGGIALDAAMRAGYKKFVVVLTRPRDYVKGGVRRILDEALKVRFHNLPAIREAVLKRPARYNAVRQKIFELEEAGRAWVFAPNATYVDSSEMSVPKLDHAYQQSATQFATELPSLKAFLGL